MKISKIHIILNFISVNEYVIFEMRLGEKTTTLDTLKIFFT